MARPDVPDVPDVPGHLALLAGRRSDGEPVHEVVPARRCPDGLWLLLGTPALAEGCAEGDVLAVSEEGAFHVANRGGNVSIVSYAANGGTVLPHADALRRLLGPRAKVETRRDGGWLVATVPISVGFPAIQAAMAEWVSVSAQTWSYGNVYDENDQPLNWW